MKAESNLQPKNKFEIENIIDGKCDIVFYDNVVEIATLEDEEKRYSYNMYRFKTNYRDDLEKELNDNVEKFNKWLELARNTEYNELAEEIRTKRDELLKDSDKFMCIDRLNIEIPENVTTTSLLNCVKNLFEGLGNAINGEYAKYRQALRDIPEQPGFPYNVEFPKKPTNTNEEESMKID